MAFIPENQTPAVKKPANVFKSSFTPEPVNEALKPLTSFVMGHVEGGGTPSFSALGKNLKELGGLAVGAVKGATESLQTVGNIVAKPVAAGIDKLSLKEGQTAQPVGFTEEQLAAKTPIEAFGKGAERIAEFIIPEGIIAKAVTKLPTIVGAGAKIAKDVAVAGVQSKGDVQDMTVTGLLSAGTRGIVPAVKLLGNTFKRTLGLLANRGTDLVNEVVENPTAAKAGLRGDPVKTLKDSATQLSQYAKQVDTGAKDAFKEGLDYIEKNYDEVVSGFKNIPDTTGAGFDTIKKQAGTSIITDPQGNRFNLSLGSLKSFLTNSLKTFNVGGGSKAGFDFRNASLSDQEERLVQKAFERIQNWDDITPTGINRLADVVKGFARPESGSMERANAILWNTASKIDDYLIERVPKVGELNAAYTQANRFLEEMSVHLNAIGKATSPREIARVSTKIQNLFGANKDTARAFLEGLPGGKDILGTEAGRQLGIADISKASGSIGNFIANVIQTVVPPKAIGEIAAGYGISIQKAEQIYNAVKPLETTAQATVLNLLRDVLNPQE